MTKTNQDNDHQIQIVVDEPRYRRMRLRQRISAVVRLDPSADGKKAKSIMTSAPTIMSKYHRIRRERVRRAKALDAQQTAAWHRCVWDELTWATAIDSVVPMSVVAPVRELSPADRHSIHLQRGIPSVALRKLNLEQLAFGRRVAGRYFELYPASRPPPGARAAGDEEGEERGEEDEKEKEKQVDDQQGENSSSTGNSTVAKRVTFHCIALSSPLPRVPLPAPVRV